MSVVLEMSRDPPRIRPIYLENGLNSNTAPLYDLYKSEYHAYCLHYTKGYQITFFPQNDRKVLTYVSRERKSIELRTKSVLWHFNYQYYSPFFYLLQINPRTYRILL